MDLVQQSGKQQDLVVAEEKLDSNISFQDYRDLASFTIGIWAIILYAIVSIGAAVL